MGYLSDKLDTNCRRYYRETLPGDVENEFWLSRRIYNTHADFSRKREQSEVARNRQSEYSEKFCVDFNAFHVSQFIRCNFCVDLIQGKFAN